MLVYILASYVPAKALKCLLMKTHPASCSYHTYVINTYIQCTCMNVMNIVALDHTYLENTRMHISLVSLENKYLTPSEKPGENPD